MGNRQIAEIQAWFDEHDGPRTSSRSEFGQDWVSHFMPLDLGKWLKMKGFENNNNNNDMYNIYIYMFIVTFHISLWNGWRCVYPIDIPSALVPQGAYANPIACLLAVDGRENFWEDPSPRFDLATCRTCSPRREHVADLGKGGSLEKWRCKKNQQHVNNGDFNSSWI